MEEVSAKTFYLLRTAFWYELYANNEIEKLTSKPNTLQNFQYIYHYYRSMVCLFEIVNGKGLKEEFQKKLSTLLEDANPVLFHENESRLRYSAYMLSKRSAFKHKGLLKCIVFAMEINRRRIRMDIEFKQNEALGLLIENLEHTIEEKIVDYDRIFQKEHIERIEKDPNSEIKVVKTNENSDQRLRMSSRPTHVISKKPGAKPKPLKFDFSHFLTTLKNSTYFNANEFASFHDYPFNSKVTWSVDCPNNKYRYDEKKQLYYCNLNRKPGMFDEDQDVEDLQDTFIQNEDLYSSSSSSSSSSSNIDTQKQKESSISNTMEVFPIKIASNLQNYSSSSSSSSSSDIDTQKQKESSISNTMEVFPIKKASNLQNYSSSSSSSSSSNIDTQKQKESLYSRYQEFTSSSGSYMGIDIPIRKNVAKVVEMIEVDQPIVAKQNLEADQVLSYFNPKDAPEVNEEKLKEYLKSSVKVLSSVGETNREVIKEYIQLMSNLNYKQNLSKTYQDIFESLRKEKQSELRKLVLSDQITDKGAQTSLSNFSKVISYWLGAIAYQHIKSFFESLLIKYEQSVKLAIQSEQQVKQWESLMNIPEFKDVSASYFELASKLRKHGLNLKKRHPDQKTIKSLLHIFETVVPSEWINSDDDIQLQATPVTKEMIEFTEDNVEYFQEEEESENVGEEKSEDESPTSTFEMESDSSGGTRSTRSSVYNTNLGKHKYSPSVHDVKGTKKRRSDETPTNRVLFTPQKAVPTNQDYKKVMDDLCKIFENNYQWILPKTQITVDHIFSLLGKNQSIDDLMTNLEISRLWSYVTQPELTINDADNDELEFIRAHYRLFEMLAPNQSGDSESDKELVKQAYQDAQEHEEVCTDKEIAQNYRKRVYLLYEKYYNLKENVGEVVFSAEDFTLPFLWRNLHNFNYLTFYQAEEGNNYSARSVVINGKIIQKPFRLTDLISSAPYNIYVNSEGTRVNVLPLNNDLLVSRSKEFISRTTAISNLLLEISKFVKDAGMHESDMEFMASKYIDYLSNSDTDLNKSSFVSKSSKSGLTTQSSSSSTSNALSIETVKAIQDELLRQFQEEEQEKIREIFNKFVTL